MKKGMLLCLVTLLCLLLASASGEELMELDLYAVVGESQTLVGGAALIGATEDGAVFLGAGAVPEGAALMLTDRSGEYPVREAARLEAGGGLVLFTGPEAAENRQGLSTAGNPADAVYCIGWTRTGEWLSGDVSRVTAFQSGEDRLVVLNASADLIPGAVIYTRQWEPVGVITASLGEGRGRWLAMGAVAARNAFLRGGVTYLNLAGMGPEEKPALPALPQEGPVLMDDGYVAGLGIKTEEGLTYVSWEGVTPADPPEGAVWRVYWQMDVNSYFTWADVELSESRRMLPLIPGGSYAVWVRLTDSDGVEDDPELPFAAMSAYTVPGGERIDRYGYSEENVWVTTAGADVTYGDTEEIPRAEISASGILDRGDRFWIQITSLYDVAEDVQENLLFVLTSQDGEKFVHFSGFLYMGGLKPDVWHADLTSLMASALNWSETVKGTWSLSWYYNGSFVNETFFTLVP